ncbi:MAG TPA: HEAT repeat domain-containing protein [Syntrophorhabdaceae bacterium]|nr:HEAT repeat domain-containing protein [Syntrophorhabdaceae bacterium]
MSIKKKFLKLKETLIHGNSLERERAMEQIIAEPSKEIVEMVIELLYLKETVVRMFAVDILKNIGRYNMGAVLKLLKDPDEDIRIYACEILGGMKEKETVPYLIETLEDESPNVRNLACTALGDIGDDSAIDALFSALKDDEWVEFSAVSALGKIGSKDVIEPLFEIFRNGNEIVSLIACETLINFKEKEILDRVIETLRAWDGDKRKEYIKVILEKEDEEMFFAMQEKMGQELFEHLMDLAKSEDKKSIKILKLISYFKKPQAAEVILDALAGIDPDSDEYYDAINLFSEMGSVWASHAQDFFEKDERCMVPLIRACAANEIKIDEDILLDKFLTSSIEIKREIIQHLPRILRQDGFRIVKEALDDPDGHIKGDALTAIGGLGLKEFKDKVIELARNGYMDVRQKALRTLINLDFVKFHEIISDFALKGTKEDKKVYLSIAPFVNKDMNYPIVRFLLKERDETIRKSTINLIGRFLDDEKYFELFKNLVDDDNVPHEALKIIKDKKMDIFKDRLVQIFLNTDNEMWTRYYALLALGSFKDTSLFDIFLRGLDSDSNIIKLGSLKALSNLNDKRVLDYIKPYLISDNEDIRLAAESILEKFHSIPGDEGGL